MREIVFDTETTGLDNREDRVIEIGGVELVDRFPTGRTYHVYIEPEGRKVHPDAEAVHGISNADLADKPKFKDIASEFIEFFAGAKLIAHNARFDQGFINAELARIGHPPLDENMIIDTLAIARRKHPMGPNSLDALCKRYGIDNSRREKHGALLDSEILAEVYIELIGGKQAALILDPNAGGNGDAANQAKYDLSQLKRPKALPPRLHAHEQDAHKALVESLGDDAIWRSYNS